MKLDRRYARNIRENLSFNIAATVLTVVTLLLFYLFNIAGSAILDFSEDFYAENHLEDAHFSTYLPISNSEIDALERDYNLQLEPQRYINIETDGVTARVFARTKNIDLYQVTVGRDVQGNNEAVISEGYAVAANVQIGDCVKIADQQYEVVGFMQRPDYLYMLENEDDSYKNINTLFLCYLSDADFEALDATAVQYLVRYQADTDVNEFRRAVHDAYYMRSYSAAAENPRITMVAEQAEMFILMSYLLLCILPLIAVALICIIISRKVKSEQRMIGTLSAMGYKKGQLMRHYAGFAVLPGLVGGILTAVISVIAAQPMAEAGLTDYEPMRVVGHLSPLIAVLGVVVPAIIYALAACLAVRRLLNVDTVLLLNGMADGGKKKMRRLLAGQKISFRIKFALRALLGNPARSLVILLGVFLGCFIMLLGLGMYDSAGHMGTTASKQIGNFEYEYILNEMLSDNPYDGQTLLVSSLEDAEGKAVSVVGTSADNPYLNLKDAAGNNVLVEDGYFATSLAAYYFGWQEGDTVELYNPITLEKSEVTIAGIIQNNVQKSIVSGKHLVAELTGLDETKFNCILSDTALSIPDTEVAQTVKASAISEQADTMMEMMDFMLALIIVLGVIICVAAVYVAVDMLVAESRSNISMLKVLGYRDGQINRIVLSVHHILVPIGILLAIPAAYACADAFFRLMVDNGVMRMDVYISPAAFAISIGLTVFCYAGSLFFLRRKVKRVSMIESLKDNRE
jgi:putative ABC transport system permease protein